MLPHPKLPIFTICIDHSEYFLPSPTNLERQLSPSCHTASATIFSNFMYIHVHSEILLLDIELHSAAPLPNHLRKRGAPVSDFSPLAPANLHHVLLYFPHALVRQDPTFNQGKILDQNCCIHNIILSLSLISYLTNLWVSLVLLVPQEGWRPRLIYNYNFSGMNDAVHRPPPHNTIKFGGTLCRLLTKNIIAYPTFGPVLLPKYT